MIRSFDLEEFKHLTHHVEDVRAGRYVIMVLTKRREQRIVAGDILHQYGAEFVGFYGRWAWADVPPSHHMTPADVPAMFVRAWNARDADALASLFDGDAEFVNGTGRALARPRVHTKGARGPAAGARRLRHARDRRDERQAAVA